METENLMDDAADKLMLPPTPGTFGNREELISYVREFGASQGYVVTIKKSKRDRRVILGCDRGGVYRDRHKVEEKKHKRKVSSRLINCPFEAIGKKDDDVWVLTVKHGEHNHDALRDMSDHRYSRRFTEEEVAQIKLMTEAGLKPRQVLKALKQNNPELQSTPRHLYNVKAKIRQGNFTAKTFKPWRPNNSTAVFTPSESSIQHNHPPKVPNLIGGKFLESKACAFLDVVNPATQELVSQVPLTTYDEFKAAVSAAKQAFPKWKNTPSTVRQRIMFKFQELIRKNTDKLASSLTTEQGKTLKGAKGDVLRGLEVIEHACGMATSQMGNFAPNESSGIDTYCSREPLGVCAGICPFDFPAMFSLWMFPLAVTCGNTFILKPSELNPGASMIIAELAMEAGLPDGVLNIVHGAHDIVNEICDDDDVKAISLISSNSNDGMYTYARAAASGKRVQSSMGVKNHAIVMPDASIDATLDALVSAGFGTAGQRSMALNTVIFVGVSGSWEEELVRRAKALKVTAGKEPGADLGPVISKEAKDHICRQVESGVESGARLILDGRHIMVPRYERGNFVGPTILCDVTTSMNCYKDEMSGPVLLCMQVDKLEEAVTIVNRDKNGCGASIFTTSCVAARKFQNEVDAELVGVNVPVPIPSTVSSFDSSKASISGDLNFYGKAGVQFYTKVKIVAQKWRDLPARRLLLPSPQISETQRYQAPHEVQPPTYGSDIGTNLEVLPATPSAFERDIASQNALLSLPPSSEVGSPNPIPHSSTSQTIVRELLSEGRTSLSTQQTSERMHRPLNFQSGDSLSLKSPSTASNLSPSRTYVPVLPASLKTTNTTSTSLRMDISIDRDSEISVPTSHRKDILSLLSSGDDNMGSNLSMTHINTHPTFGSIYAPTASQMANSVGLPNSGGVYMQPPQADIELIHARAIPVMHPVSEREYLHTSYRSDMVHSQMTGSMPLTTEKMYMPSVIQRNDEPTASERFGQRFFDPATVYMSDYSGHGARHGAPSTSQRR
ncbi:Methylmalonate-semialdehyde dehydrogenase (CoA acylating) [Heracleum sosnowskyi]|uniref:methylmalonate-semialdehyde dehydrogenase (CoA acylating) n=1 Tax=Heracleum sosnowskyi TaxID=360622 RepID=A0AAD8HQP6_9APIA|nr:Methylmalonate-semialdehyde dehydrogenase (CoA acylating) [Heracleum sosnowskyi]